MKKTTILSQISDLMSQKELVLVAIDGFGGSGKTTLANKIEDAFKTVTIIQMDDFYSPQLKRPDVERLAVEVLQPLTNKQAFSYNIYDWENDTFVESDLVLPTGIIIIEGVFSLHELIRDFYDLKIWIECAPEEGLRRGIERDKNEHGIDTSSKWVNDWMPREKEYIELQQPQNSADIILDS